MTKTPRRQGLITWALLAIVGALVAAQGLGEWGDEGPEPWPATRAQPPGPMIGVTTLALARHSAIPWRTEDLRQVNDFERGARRHADVVMWFADWESATFDARQAEAIRRRGSIPEVSWEPWDSRLPAGRPQPRYRLSRIIDGRHDAVVRRFARAVAGYGHPIRLRFAQEMNGRLYPWAERVNGNERGEFARAWRHVHRIFADEGATNVTWIWAPVVGDLPARLYPGDRYVDVVGVSGFNGGRSAFGGRWRPFAPVFGPALDHVHHLAPSKPVVVAEVASAEAGGDKARWIREMFAEVRRRPYVEGVMWFNLQKEADWRIGSSPEAERAFAESVAPRPGRPGVSRAG